MSMTDEQIVMFMERCYNKEKAVVITQFNSDDTITKITLDDILSVIHRQRVEVERLKANLNIDLDNFASEYDSKIKAEAIKEFAEKVELEIVLPLPHRREIQNLVKEMVGDVNTAPTTPKKFVFEIEHFYGDRYMAFEVTLLENGTLDISRTEDCDHADTEDDYIFDSDNLLYRIISNIKELG